MKFPRYFKHLNSSDALYVRHDDEESSATVVTTNGAERLPNVSSWPLSMSLFALHLGLAVEITQEEAFALDPK